VPASPLNVSVGSSISLTLAAAKTATLGPVNVTFTGTDNSLNHSATAAFTVVAAPDFGLSIQPGTVSLTQGAPSKSISLLASPLNGFTGPVFVTLTGVPSGVTVSPGTSFQVSAGTAQQVTFAASSTASPGTANVLFSGASGSLSHTANATMQVQAIAAQDFSISVSPGTVAMTQGSTSRPVGISISGLNGFSGNVTVSLSGLPSGVTASESSVTISAGSSEPVTFSAAINAKPISASVAFQGTSGSINHSTDATVEVMSDAVFSTTYFSNADTSGVADGTVQIVNPGIQSTPSTTGTMCANIYVFDENQEMKECCSCPITANGAITLSVNTNLTSNPTPPTTFPNNQGTISVVPGTIPSTGLCDASNVVAAPDLNVWSTHTAYGLSGTTATFPVVETPAADLALSGSALTDFVTVCGDIEANDSGAGMCTCGSTSGGDALRQTYAAIQ